MKTIIPISLALILSACTAAAPRQDAPLPEQAARLSMAQCPAPAPNAAADYNQQLKPKGQLKLFAKPELEGALGGVEGEILHARKVREGVWAVLVSDFDKKLCEVYVSEDAAELINNDPGPESMDAGMVADAEADHGLAESDQ